MVLHGVGVIALRVYVTLICVRVLNRTNLLFLKHAPDTGTNGRARGGTKHLQKWMYFKRQ